MGRSGKGNKLVSKSLSRVSSRKKITRKKVIYTAQDIVKDIIQAIEDDGILPWQMPWAQNGLPQNNQTGKKYRGFNKLVLSFLGSRHGYSSSKWMTYKQAEEASYQQWLKDNNKKNNDQSRLEYQSDPNNYKGVNKGAGGTKILFYKPFEVDKDKDGNPLKDKDGNPITKELSIKRTYTVFNAEQTGLDIPADVKLRENVNPIKEAEEVISNCPSPPKIKHGGDSAHYDPKTDTITMPERGRFKSDEDYYQTLFHELIHATAHKSRTDRMNGDWSRFGSDPYAKEELVAELGSAMLMSLVGINNQQTANNQKAYVQSWVKRFKEKPNMIIEASNEAQKAIDFIFGIKFDEEPSNS
jgi:antirestriction protein ArdC